MFKLISSSIVVLAVLTASVFYTPNTENLPLLGNSALSTASSETIGTFRLRVNEFIGDANFNWTSSTQLLEVIGLASTTQLRTPSATIASLKDASGNAYSTSSGGLAGTSTSTYLSVYTGASTLGGFANLNWTSSTNLFEVIGLASTTQFRSPSSTITGLTFGNATTSGNLTAATGIFTTSVSTTLASTTNISFTNATGTNTTITTLKDVSGNSYVTSTTSTLQIFVETETGVNDNAIWVADFAGTLVKATAVNKTNTDTVTFNLGWGASRGTATTSLKKAFTAYQTVTATTTPSTLTINGSTTFAVGDVFRYFTSAASSTEVSISISVR